MRVALREVSDGDLSRFFEQQLHPDANRMAAFVAGDPADKDAFMAHWAKIRADPTVMIRTILLDEEVAGYVASWIDTSWAGRPEVTYWIGKEYWGRGVATRALTEFLTVQKERPIYARAPRDNAASLRVLEKCGFKIIGYGRGFANARGSEIEEAQLRLQ